MPPFESLNVGQHVGDCAVNVAKNRQMLPNHERIVWLNQTHSSICVNLDSVAEHSDELLAADASVSTIQNKVCAVMTADCLPILLCDKKGSVVAAIHAGWRGLADGVIEATVEQMAVLGKNLMAWLGPAISQPNFEVGVEVKQSFAQYPGAFKANTRTDAEKFFADLYLIASEKLHQLGVKNVYGGEFCTYQDSQRFFSHRRATHQHANSNQVVSTGRMVSAIYLAKSCN